MEADLPDVAVEQPQIALLQYNEIFYVALMQILKIDKSCIEAHQLNRMRGSLCTARRNSIPFQGVLIEISSKEGGP
jgi:hypothetical protein